MYNNKTNEGAHEKIWFDDMGDRYNGTNDYQEENDTSRTEAGAYRVRTVAHGRVCGETSERDA